MTSIAIRRLKLASLCLFAGLLSDCTTDEYQRMQAEAPDVQAQETISCNSRDLRRARHVMLRGEACALTANDAGFFSRPEIRGQRHQCALTDAATDWNLLPADAQKQDLDNALLLVLDAWQSARDGQATPAALRAAVDTLRSRPGGAPYPDTLAAGNLTYHVETQAEPKATECSNLRQARQLLPNGTSGDLAARFDAVRAAINSASRTRGCPG
jgi:hypothetical protein